jgi:hypothetical protein
MTFSIEAKTIVKMQAKNTDQYVSNFVLWKNGLRRNSAARPRYITGARYQ